MLILGIDPGTGTTGYGIVEVQGSNLQAVDYGAIRTKTTDEMPTRLCTLHDALKELIEASKPDVIAVEQLFFNTNVTSAIAVGQARGVILLTAAQAKIPLAEYTPLQVKQTITGHGRATKQQVGFMVKALLSLKTVPRPDDVADALAIAICHAHMGLTYDRLVKSIR
ncbi:MAG: crossover junction endodeoxyribonuclease RuvC [Firmicutes bacterium]|nr:crossover junction endodeoxyribonuclease RuvC [Bacillota bacterium]